MSLQEEEKKMPNRPINHRESRCDYARATDVGTRFQSAREFIGSLASLHTEGYGNICTGTIISEFVILTAASCFIRMRPHYVRIHSPYSSMEGRMLEVIRIDPHYEFSNKTLENDIALVEVKESTISDAKFDFMPLVEKNGVVTVGKKATVLGWGLLQHDGSQPSELKKFDLNTVSLNQCRRMYEGPENSQICVYSPGKGTCDGDQGSPLIIDGLQVGVASTIQCVDNRREPDSQGFFPGIFTNVALYREWIDNHIQAMLKDRLYGRNKDWLPKPTMRYEAHTSTGHTETVTRRVQPSRDELTAIEAEYSKIRSAEQALRIREQNLTKLLKDYYARSGQHTNGFLTPWIASREKDTNQGKNCK
ncbi:hypothetical protein QAD02_001610 [Eretmocerus hayati]|uniref:Uncharacterized protein n=1 Tax=Eretmocerus hayati TaxID=131215 RepID=A0ACC2NHF1_9HYME|nr:hypothetical protein QAD02_001610 [Eretmocerus hayati]